MYSGIAPFSLIAAIRAFMPVTRYQWWFASAYFVLYLIHPYVNRLLHSFTRGEYRKFLLSVMIYWCLIPTLTHSNFGANGTVNFVCLYSLAGYVRLYPDDFGKRRYILWGLAFIGANCLSALMLDIIGLKIPFAGQHAIYLLGFMRPFTIAASVYLLVGFSNLVIPHSKLINSLASATFGVYLIHEHPFVRPFLWQEVFRNASFQDSPYLIPYSVAVILIIYTACTILELSRSRIFRLLSHGKLS